MRSTRNIGLMAAAVAALAVATPGSPVVVASRPVPKPQDEPRRDPAPSGGRAYKPNGKREVERRRRQREKREAREATEIAKVMDEYDLDPLGDFLRAQATLTSGESPQR